jgi:hypothetical protein
MSSRIAAVLLLVGFGFQGLCQTAPAAASPPKVPDNIVYEAFFQKVLFLEDVAKKLDARKKSGARARATIQHAIGMTDKEAATLKALAADWRTQLVANQAANAPLFQAAKSQVAASGALSASTVQQIQALQSQRAAIATAHIQQFQAGVGSARFALIDAAVRASSTVHAVKVPSASAPTAAGTGGKP